MEEIEEKLSIKNIIVIIDKYNTILADIYFL